MIEKKTQAQIWKESEDDRSRVKARTNPDKVWVSLDDLNNVLDDCGSYSVSVQDVINQIRLRCGGLK